jgi:hypothetical protein
MKKNLFSIVFIIALISCNSQEAEKRPNTSMDVGREFIRTTLDGDFKKAEELLLKDSLNLEMFDKYEKFYANKLTSEVKQGYKKASYNINKIDDVNDSTVIINYSNTFMNKPTNIKLVKKDKLWSVDFTFTTSDTTSVK